MKFLKAFILVVLASAVFTKKFIPAHTHLVTDKRGDVAQLSHIVRPNPTLTATHNFGYPTPYLPNNRVTFSHSSDSNAPNLGSYGKTAIIASPGIVIHNVEDMSVVHRQPGLVGIRDEHDTITSVNKINGVVEQHKISRSIPIEGIIEKVHTLKKETTRRLDFGPNNQWNPSTKINSASRWGPLTTTITEKH